MLEDLISLVEEYTGDLQCIIYNVAGRSGAGGLGARSVSFLQKKL